MSSDPMDRDSAAQEAIEEPRRPRRTFVTNTRALIHTVNAEGVPIGEAIEVPIERLDFTGILDPPAHSQWHANDDEHVLVFPLDGLGWPILTDPHNVHRVHVTVDNPVRRIQADDERHTEMVTGTAVIDRSHEVVAMHPAEAARHLMRNGVTIGDDDRLTPMPMTNTLPRVVVDRAPLSVRQQGPSAVATWRDEAARLYDDNARMSTDVRRWVMVELDANGEATHVIPVESLSMRMGHTFHHDVSLEAVARLSTDAVNQTAHTFARLREAIERARISVSGFAEVTNGMGYSTTPGTWTAESGGTDTQAHTVAITDEGAYIDGEQVAQAAPAPRTVFAFNVERRSNADLILDAHRLRYLRNDDAILDATYGRGAMWQRWQPINGDVWANDLWPDGGARTHHDFRWFDAFVDEMFDAVVFDPPYKLNGTPAMGEMDERYGVSTYTRWQDRYSLIEDGLVECARVCKRHLLVKCMDQVVSGRVRWQTHDFVAHVQRFTGMRLVDELHLPGSREQPAGRRQAHARRNYSTLLVFHRGLTRPLVTYEPRFERERVDGGGYLITNRLTGVNEAVGVA